MSARVSGNMYGGNDVTVECPFGWPAVGTFEQCGAEVEVHEQAGTYTVPAECPGCGRSGEEFRDALVELAKDAIDNYDGPTDAELAAQYESSFPTVQERQTAAWRLK